MLENSSSLSRFGDRWSGLPSRQRRALTVAALVPTAVVAIMLVASEGREWVVEQGLRDEVSLTGTVRVWAASTTPAGGSVNYSVAIRNTGRRSVQITAVSIVQSRLRVTNREQSLPRLAPGETAGIDVSVRLDCTVGVEFGPHEALRGVLSVSPSADGSIGWTSPLSTRHW